MLDTPPKTAIFGHLRVKVDQLTCGKGYGRAMDLSEGQGHIPYVTFGNIYQNITNCSAHM